MLRSGCTVVPPDESGESILRSGCTVVSPFVAVVDIELLLDLNKLKMSAIALVQCCDYVSFVWSREKMLELICIQSNQCGHKRYTHSRKSLGVLTAHGFMAAFICQAVKELFT